MRVLSDFPIKAPAVELPCRCFEQTFYVVIGYLTGEENMVNYKLIPFTGAKDGKTFYTDAAYLADRSLMDIMEQEEAEDRIRVYVPLDISEEDILRRMYRLTLHYGEANEDNEFEFREDVEVLIGQIELYDRFWLDHNGDISAKHSRQAVELVKKFIAKLEEIPDGCAEFFPFETIDELRREYLR